MSSAVAFDVRMQTKRAGRRLQQRSVAQAAVAKWQARIEEMEGDIRTIMKQEK